MEKLVTLTSVAVPLPIDNCDTDQIMPKQFLRGIDKSGLARGTFFNMRYDAQGHLREDCLFNQPEYKDAKMIVAGPNFGCGSSREHAVWGLMQMGFRVVIATGFGEIFYSNCFNNGLLAAKVTPEVSEEIFEAVGRGAKALTIDVAHRTISDGEKTWSFEIGERHQHMMLEGLDMVGATLKDLDAIRDFKNRHEAQVPWMAGLPAKAKGLLKY